MDEGENGGCTLKCYDYLRYRQLEKEFFEDLIDVTTSPAPTGSDSWNVGDNLQPSLPCALVNFSAYCFSSPELRYFNAFHSWEPDYWTINYAHRTFLPGFGPDLQVTRDYYGKWYIAAGVYGGSPRLSLFGGYMGQEGRPTPEQLAGFITEDSFSLGGGNILGGGGTWGHVAVGSDGITWDDFASEGGLTSPGGLGTWTYGVEIEDFFNIIKNAIGL